MIELFMSLSPIEYVRIGAEIIILTYVIYKLYSAVAETRAAQMAVVFVSMALIYGFSKLFGLTVIEVIFSKLFVPFMMMLVVFYHPELRRAFSGTSRRSLFHSAQTSASQLDSVLAACSQLVTKKRGALIVFPRHNDMKNITDTGTRLNAELSANLILTIFDHDTPLHDGACFIQGGKCTYAACYLPLSNQSGIKDSFGTRHRAALGLTEETDAVVVIVSEETGAISLAYNANIYYNLDVEVVKGMLLMLLSDKDVLPQDIKVSSGDAGREDDNADSE